MCEHCNGNEDLRDVKGFNKIYKELGDRPYEDLSGKKFGRLTAVRAVGRKKDGSVLWLCECECSNKVITLGYSLKRLESKSCGCYNIEVCKSRNFKDLTGQVFGRLTVVRRVENRGNKSYYECLCSCGNTVIVRGTHLKSGLIQSCKCLQKERIHEANFVDLTGKKFGRLLVTGIAEMSSDKNGHRTMYFVTCDCGNKKIIDGGYLVGKQGTKSCGCLHREVTSKRKLDDLTGKKFGNLQY